MRESELLGVVGDEIFHGFFFFFLMQHLFQNDIISTHGFHFAFVMLFFQTLKFYAQICLYSSKTQLPITGNMLINRYQNNKINISETIVAFSSYTYTLLPI